jgi:5-methylcytosine-specific restriction endonuclease McrA
MPDTKRCQDCDELKELSAFSRDRTRPDGLHPHCRPCRAIRSADHYERNKAKVAAQRAAFRAANPEVIRAHRAKYYATHTEQHRALTARWHRENAKNVAERHARAHRQHPERARMRNAAFRARAVNAPGRGVTAAEWLEMLDASCGLCAYCAARVPLTADHIEPLKHGGAHDPDNIAVCCRPCNSSKADTPLLVWMVQRRSA